MNNFLLFFLINKVNLMWKKLVIGKEPENTKIFCDCGMKYRSDTDWIYQERDINPDLELIKNHKDYSNMLNFMVPIQTNKYKCPYCNITEKISDPTVSYTKSQIIKFCDITNTKIDKNDTKKQLLEKLFEKLELN